MEAGEGRGKALVQSGLLSMKERELEGGYVQPD
jgi:hypothetical protein